MLQPAVLSANIKQKRVTGYSSFVHVIIFKIYLEKKVRKNNRGSKNLIVVIISKQSSMFLVFKVVESHGSKNLIQQYNSLYYKLYMLQSKCVSTPNAFGAFQFRQTRFNHSQLTTRQFLLNVNFSDLNIRIMNYVYLNNPNPWYT